MSDRLQAAEQALKGGRIPEAIDQLKAAIAEDPARPVQVWRVLTVQLYHSKRYDEGESYAAMGIERFPSDISLINMRGVLLRQLKRPHEALNVLEEGLRIAPGTEALLVNQGNVLLDLDQPAKAEAIFTKLLRRDPRNAEHQRQLARALLKQDKRDAAAVRFRQAVSIQKDHVSAWLDLVGLLLEDGRNDEAERTLEKALAANPGHARLLEGKAILLRRVGRGDEVEGFLRGLLEQHPDAGWLQYQLAAVVADYDRQQANIYFRRAAELEPTNVEYQLGLVESLERTRTVDEAAFIDEAYELAVKSLALKPAGPMADKILTDVFSRVCDYERLEAVGDTRTIGRGWATSGRHTALLKLIPRVRSMEDRYELLEQHKIWGRKTESLAKASPIRRPKRPVTREKIRLGFMSSDLRMHPVAYFSQPVFQHMDERFEVFCYSYFQGKAADQAQQWIASQVTGFRWNPHVSNQEAAQIIADDGLDVLLELGGSTYMNRPEVMAYRPARVQGSWLGYAHSVGLDTIDHLVVDPYLNPDPQDLLQERPLIMPASWIALGVLSFPDEHQIDPTPPCARNGYVTFGTANNPGKYGPEMLRTWARVVAATPNSRFVFVRPEGGSVHFRRNILSYFAAEGVSEDRVEFVAVRGVHMPHYNRMDIALDTFPQTGGTTTCEAAWMGVPTITLVGPALYERMSYSILSNAGLGDLCTWTVADYEKAALALAEDRSRIADLRSGLRDRLRQSPLGRTEQFARDFYDLMAKAAEGGAQAKVAR